MQTVRLGEEAALEQYLEFDNFLKPEEEVKKTKKKKKKGKKADQAETEPLPASNSSPQMPDAKAPEKEIEEPELPLFLNYEDVNREVAEFSKNLEALRTEYHGLYSEVGREHCYFGCSFAGESHKIKPRVSKLAISRMKKAMQRGEFSKHSEEAPPEAPAPEEPPVAAPAQP
mmetsp:Transcript_16068/g.24946  ORF Transcript_16068/g.24946 Transcript_16068/m.24946 type:complete len:172 (+) Transcript_16068:2625-3140(+)